MRRIRIVLAVVLLANSIQRLDSQSAVYKQSLLRAEGSPSEESIIEYLKSTLASIGYKARIYFHGTCDVGGDQGVRFPSIYFTSPLGDKKGVPAVREMFGKDKNVTVTADTSGVIRINIGSVFKPILNARLPSLRLTQSAQYNPNGPGGAIDAIESSAAVQAAMEKFGVHQESVFYIGLEEPALVELPHLPSEMKDMTVDQALDSIAKTFPGVVVYGECEQPDKDHTVDIRFVWFSQGGQTASQARPHDLH
jgi:hypothetical protein